MKNKYADFACKILKNKTSANHCILFCKEAPLRVILISMSQPVINKDAYIDGEELMNSKYKTQPIYGESKFKTNINLLSMGNFKKIFDYGIWPKATQTVNDIFKTDSVDVFFDAMNDNIDLTEEVNHWLPTGTASKLSIDDSRMHAFHESSAKDGDPKQSELKKCYESRTSESFPQPDKDSEITKQIYEKIVIQKLVDLHSPLNDILLSSSPYNAKSKIVSTLPQTGDFSMSLVPLQDKKPLWTYNFSLSTDCRDGSKLAPKWYLDELLQPKDFRDHLLISPVQYFSQTYNFECKSEFVDQFLCDNIYLDSTKPPEKKFQVKEHDEKVYNDSSASGDGSNQVYDGCSDHEDSIGLNSSELSDFEEFEENFSFSSLTPDSSVFNSKNIPLPESTACSNQNKKVEVNNFSIDNPIRMECINYDTGKKETLIIYSLDQLATLKSLNKRSNKDNIIQKMASISKKCHLKNLGAMLSVKPSHLYAKKAHFKKPSEASKLSLGVTGRPTSSELCQQNIAHSSKKSSECLPVGSKTVSKNSQVNQFETSLSSATTINQSNKRAGNRLIPRMVSSDTTVYTSKSRAVTHPFTPGIVSVKQPSTVAHKPCLKRDLVKRLVPRPLSLKPFSLTFSLRALPHSDTAISYERGKVVSRSANVEKIISSDFRKFFHFFAKRGHRLMSGSVISRGNSNCWMKRAGIVTDKKSRKAANDCFSETAGKKLVLNIYDYTLFLQTFSKSRKQTLVELISQLKTVDISEAHHKKIQLPCIQENNQRNCKSRIIQGGDKHSFSSKIPQLHGRAGSKDSS